MIEEKPIPSNVPASVRYQYAAAAVGIRFDPRLDGIETGALLREIEARLAAGANKTEIGRRAYRPYATPEEIAKVKAKNKPLEAHYFRLHEHAAALRSGFDDLLRAYQGEPR